MKLAFNLVLIILAINLVTGAADASGMWDDWGVEINAGVSDQIDETVDAFKSISAGGFGAQTLIGVFAAGAETLRLGLQIVVAFPTLLENIGLPSFIAQAPTAMLTVIVGRSVLMFFSGRDI